MCLWNTVCVPQAKPLRHVIFADVNAYNWCEKRPLDKPACAANLQRPDIEHHSYHSIMLDEDCVFEFDALLMAQELHAEVLNDDFEAYLASFEAKATCEPSSHTAHCSNGDPVRSTLATGPAQEHSSFQQQDQNVLAPSPLPEFENYLNDLRTGHSRFCHAFEAAAFRITTWYVDQLRVPSQTDGRIVELGPEPQTWKNAILDAWRDLALPDQEARFSLALPQPLISSDDAEIHVLVLQTRLPGLATIFLHITVDIEDYQLTTLRAETVGTVANHEMIYQVAQLGRHCVATNPDTICTIRYSRTELPENRPIFTTDAMMLEVKVYNELREDISPFSGLLSGDIDDFTSLIHLDGAGRILDDRARPGRTTVTSPTNPTPHFDGWQCKHPVPTTMYTEEPGDEQPWEVEADFPLGHIPDMPTIPLDVQAPWIQELAKAWNDLQIALPRPEAELEVRSWFLDPRRFARWDPWRPMLMPRSTDYWWNSIRATWFDVLDEGAAVEVRLISPDPPRPLEEVKYAFDLIVTQACEPHHLPALVVTNLFGYTIRRYTTAYILPPSITKWELIYHASADRFCSGISWPHDYHRLCDVWHDTDLVGSLPFYVVPGDCFNIDVYPPRQLPHQYREIEEGDDINFMARNPIVVRPRFDDIEPAAPHEDIPPQEQLLPQRGLEHAFPGRWYTAIAFTLDREGVIGRISSGDLAHFYRQVALILGTDADNIIEMHEIAVPPDDLKASFDYIWAIQRRRDLPDGARARLVLVDVEFCNNLPSLETETVRSLKLIVSPSTRTTILKALGLFPYCQQAPCLMKVNGDFVHDTGPFEFQHGDFLHIVLGPLHECQAIDTRMAALAFHRGLGQESFEQLATRLPEGFHIHQIPNPESYLDSLPFEEGHHLELWQTEVAFLPLGPRPITLRHDGELQETLQQLNEIRGQHARTAEDDIIEALEVERPAIRDLHGFWLRVATQQADNHRIAQAHIWYISHVRWRICPAPRAIWLGEDFTLWYDNIIQSWSDQIDDAEDVDLLLVSPQPPSEEGFDGQPVIHIILAQRNTLPNEGACLVSLQDSGYRAGRIERQALVLPMRVTREVLLTVANRLSLCLRSPRIASCVTRFGLFDVTFEPMRARPGLAFQVEIQRQQADGALGPVNFPPTLPATVPTFVRILFDKIQARRLADPEGSINLRICTWFLNHVDSHDCHYGREVDLPPDPTMWIVTILQHWADEYKIEHGVDVFLVSPTPLRTQWSYEEQFHVIVHQQPLPDHISILTTFLDHTAGHADPPGIHRAVVVPKHIRRSDVLVKTGLDEWCEDGDSIWTCRVDYSTLAIDDDTGLVGNNGFSLRISVLPDHQPAWQTLNGQDNINDETDLLQRTMHSTPRRPLNSDEDDKVRIDMHPAILAFEWIDSHFLLPCYLLPDDLPWHPNALPWLSLEPWEPHFGCGEIAVYHDGTSNKQLQGAGGVVVFIRAGPHWFAGGHWAFPLCNSNSYQAELYAALVATKATHDILKIVSLYQTSAPYVWFGYDSITVGRQAASDWQCRKEPKIGLAIRALRDLIHRRFGVFCDSFHIRGHTGDPGNEIADTLATAAAQGVHTVEIGNLDYILKNDNLQTGLAWIWMLFEYDFHHRWDGHSLTFPRLPTTSPDSTVFPQLLKAETPREHGEVHLILCSCNVLSLKEHIHETFVSTGSATRQASIIQQLDEQHVRIFALQETRIKSTRQVQHDRFLLIKGPATQQGQGGMMMGFSTCQPHGYLHMDNRKVPVYFKKEHIAIIDAGPRRLIVRISTPVLRCIAIAGHAPHTGAPDDEISLWWDQLHLAVPDRYKTWPRILLCDANARTGAHDCQGIGDHQKKSLRSQDPLKTSFKSMTFGYHLPSPHSTMDLEVRGAIPMVNGAGMTTLGYQRIGNTKASNPGSHVRLTFPSHTMTIVLSLCIVCVHRMARPPPISRDLQYPLLMALTRWIGHIFGIPTTGQLMFIHMLISFKANFWNTCHAFDLSVHLARSV